MCLSSCYIFQYKATDFVVPGAGKLDIKFTPDDGSDAMQYTVFQFENSGGVALAMYNTDEVFIHHTYQKDDIPMEQPACKPVFCHS